MELMGLRTSPCEMYARYRQQQCRHGNFSHRNLGVTLCQALDRHSAMLTATPDKLYPSPPPPSTHTPSSRKSISYKTQETQHQQATCSEKTFEEKKCTVYSHTLSRLIPIPYLRADQSKFHRASRVTAPGIRRSLRATKHSL